MNTIKKLAVVALAFVSINASANNKPKPKKSKIVIGYHTVNHKKVNEFRKWTFIITTSKEIGKRENKKCYINRK